MPSPEGVVAEAVEVVEIAEAAALRRAGRSPFTPAELAYAAAHRDPDRRLAARLAAKRAAAVLLGAEEGDIEVQRRRGAPPQLVLSPRATALLHARGAESTRVSLTHGERQAAAVVLLLGPGA